MNVNKIIQLNFLKKVIQLNFLKKVIQLNFKQNLNKVKKKFNFFLKKEKKKKHTHNTGVVTGVKPLSCQGTGYITDVIHTHTLAPHQLTNSYVYPSIISDFIPTTRHHLLHRATTTHHLHPLSPPPNPSTSCSSPSMDALNNHTPTMCPKVTSSITEGYFRNLSHYIRVSTHFCGMD